MNLLDNVEIDLIGYDENDSTNRRQDDQ